MPDTSSNRRDLQFPTRRVFLQRCAVATMGVIVLPRWVHADTSWSAGDPFSLGVASVLPLLTALAVAHLLMLGAATVLSVD